MCHRHPLLHTRLPLLLFSADSMITDPIKFGPHTVPGIWRYLLPYEAFTWQIPEERRATCNSCPRITSDNYRPDYRCCTYHPKVPNYMLGLAVDDFRTSAIIKQVSEEGWLLPDGFQATPSQWVHFLQDVADDNFGKSQNVLCPFLIKSSGYCGIYAYRNSVCSTFFCITDHGSPGRKFWDGLQSLVTQVELALSQWALQQSGFDVTAYFKRLDNLADEIERVSVRRKSTGAWSKYARRILWGDGYSHELEIYRSCTQAILDNRERLWDIANSIDIREGLRFEAATQKLVPNAYQHEIDDPIESAGATEERGTEPPYKLWSQVKKSYHKMWSLPDGNLQLSQNVQIRVAESEEIENIRKTNGTFDDPESSPYVIVFFKNGKKKRRESTEVITNSEGLALQYFRQLRSVNMTTMTTIGNLCRRDPTVFVTEWTSRKVLTHHRASIDHLP